MTEAPKARRSESAGQDEARAMGPAVVHTIGYEDATPAGLVAALKGAGIATLVDVRALANSRKPGFAKRALSEALEAAGIAYLHERALGTPAAGRAAVRAGRPAEMRRIFAAHLAGDEPQHALARLAARAREEPVCLLCLEADPAHCHRTLVAEAIGLPITHLRPAGASLPPRRPALPIA